MNVTHMMMMKTVFTLCITALS